MYTNPHVKRAIQLAGNSQSELARRCGGNVRQGHVWKWLHAKTLSGDAAAIIHRATDGAVSKYSIREDLFGPAPENSEVA